MNTNLFSFPCCDVFFFCFSSSCVLCAQCCQFLWIVYFWLCLRFSLTFVILYHVTHCVQKQENCTFVAEQYRIQFLCDITLSKKSLRMSKVVIKTVNWRKQTI